MLDRLTSMRVFAKAADLGSFTAAGVALGITSQMVGKHVSALEAKLGTPLLQRTTRRQSLTEMGQNFYERCRVILAEADAAYALAENSAGQPKGRLRVSAPVGFGSSRLAPILTDLLDRYPALEVEINLTDRYVDVVDEGYDAVLRLGPIEDTSLAVRELARHDQVACASPAYLARHSAPRDAIGVGGPCVPRFRELVGAPVCRMALRPEWQAVSGAGSESLPGERWTRARRGSHRRARHHPAARSGCG